MCEAIDGLLVSKNSGDYLTFLCARCSFDALRYTDHHFSDGPVITTQSDIEVVESDEFMYILRKCLHVICLPYKSCQI